MKLIGFIKEHNDIVIAQNYSDFTLGQCFVDEGELAQVINYLNRGKIVLGWMGYFFDIEDGTLIHSDSYLTDGVYVWPAYFGYYLKKYPRYCIDKDFLFHVTCNNFCIEPISDSKVNELEDELILLLQSGH